MKYGSYRNKYKEQELVVLPVLLTKGFYDTLLEKVRTLQLVENYGYDEHNLVVSAFESMTEKESGIRSQKSE
ncbi:MAG: hypothetical protein N4J56_007065 [Chroococcidiopsis sp. SAG 2025]|nr:hypothetical protein [Chroococcidiopsis sp. SAG 2025]